MLRALKKMLLFRYLLSSFHKMKVSRKQNKNQIKTKEKNNERKKKIFFFYDNIFVILLIID